jgi:hypothetical protein
MVMEILRKLFLSFLGAVLSFSLLTLAWAHIGHQTIHNKETVKGWFDKSGFYDQLPDIVLDKAREKGSKDLPINDPAIQSAVDKALSTGFLKNAVEGVVDGGFSFLNGDTSEPKFSINITNLKQNLGDAVKNYATERAAALPVCTATELTPDFDPYNATCRPSFVTPEQAGEVARTQLLSQEFLQKDTLSADDIKLSCDSENQDSTCAKGAGANSLATVGQTRVGNDVRTAFQKSASLPIIAAVVSLLCAVGIIFLSGTKKAGIHRVGVILIVNGVLLLMAFAVMGPIFDAVKTKALGKTSEAAAKLGLDFASAAIHSVKNLLVTYAVGYTAVGIGGVVAASRTNREVKEKTILDEETAPLPDALDALPPDIRPVKNTKKPKETKKSKQ